VPRNSLATSVYNTPSDPIAQLPEAFPILVAHNNQTRVGVLGDVRGFLGVAINLDHAAGGDLLVRLKISRRSISWQAEHSNV